MDDVSYPEGDNVDFQLASISLLASKVSQAKTSLLDVRREGNEGKIPNTTLRTFGFQVFQAGDTLS